MSTVRTQLFIKHDIFDCLNVHDIALYSFRLNDEVVSPQMNEKQCSQFFIDNPKLGVNNIGELVWNGEKIGVALEYIK